MSILVLERDRKPGAVGDDLAALDLYVELVDFGDAKIAQRFCRRFHRIFCRILPGCRAGADDFGNPIDAA